MSIFMLTGIFCWTVFSFLIIIFVGEIYKWGSWRRWLHQQDVELIYVGFLICETYDHLERVPEQRHDASCLWKKNVNTIKSNPICLTAVIWYLHCVITPRHTIEVECPITIQSFTYQAPHLYLRMNKIKLPTCIHSIDFHIITVCVITYCFLWLTEIRWSSWVHIPSKWMKHGMQHYIFTDPR